jgi:hypothetical protein
MKTISKNIPHWIKRSLILFILGSISFCASAQDPNDSLPPDPGAMYLYKIQNLNFGAFSHGVSGGSVTISNSGLRSVTGDVVPLNLGVSYFHSIFEIDAPIGSIISILNGSDVTLTGSNGGSMTLHIGNSDPPSPFVTVRPQPLRTQVNIGGIITVGNAASNPPGTYTGTFSITFNME